MAMEISRTTALIPVRTALPVPQNRELIPLDSAHPVESTLPPPIGRKLPVDQSITENINFRNVSPRQISDISLDLYAGGLLSYEDYTAIAFQPELHPDYNRTIGALIGESAAPDQRRDFVSIWNERLQFDLRHFAGDSSTVKQTARIHDLLQGLGQPTRISV
jgi:hypothetical protein